MSTVGRYQLREEIARGGMGVVYRAFDPLRQCEVAVKVLTGLQPTDRTVRRLHREANALTRLRHPHVVAVHEIGADQGRAYLALDLVEGEDLQRRVDRQGPFSSAQAAELMLPLAQALAYAHQSGVLHRDLKPANVLLTREGKPLLSDFGMAKELDGESSLTRSGQLMGTPGYWPPEQARGDLAQVGPCSDIYGLGATLYAALTGEPPVTGTSLQEVVIATLETQPLAPSKLAPHPVDRDLERICLRCLAKSPDARYPSASALGTDLERYLNGEPLAGAAAAPPASSPLGLILGALIAVLLVAVGLAVAVAVGGNEQPAEPDQVADTPAERVADESHEQVADAPATDEPRGQVALEGPEEQPPAEPVRGTSPPPPPASPPGQTSVSEADRKAADRHVDQATRHAARRRYDDARVELDRALALDPNNLRALIHRGTLRASRGEAAALADFDRAITVDPTSGVPYGSRADAKLLLKDDDGALADLNRAIELDPNFVDALIMRGQLHAKRKQHEQARADFDLAKDRSPRNSRSYFMAKQLRDQQKRILKRLRSEE